LKLAFFSRKGQVAYIELLIHTEKRLLSVVSSFLVLGARPENVDKGHWNRTEAGLQNLQLYLILPGVFLSRPFDPLSSGN
jgi:hypothetical protein